MSLKFSKQHLLLTSETLIIAPDDGGGSGQLHELTRGLCVLLAYNNNNPVVPQCY